MPPWDHASPSSLELRRGRIYRKVPDLPRARRGAKALGGGCQVYDAADPDQVDLVGERPGRLRGGLDRRGVGDAGAMEPVGHAAVVADDEPLLVGVDVGARL